MAETKTHEYSKKLLEKYDVIGKSMQPAKISFGHSFGNIEVDLRNDACLKLVDRLVATYPEQKFFRKKTAAGSTSFPNGQASESSRKH